MRNFLDSFSIKGNVCLLFLFCLFTSMGTKAQNVSINNTGTAANASSMLDVSSTTKGLLIPRMTLAQRTAAAMNPLPAAAQGLLVYQTDGVEGFYYNTSLTTTPNWVYLSSGGGGGGGRWDQITAPVGSLALAHGANSTAFSFDGITSNYGLSMSSNSLTTGGVLVLTSNSTAGDGALPSQVLGINRSGANTNSGHSAMGIYSSVTNTGASSTNYGGYFQSSGGAGNFSVYAVTDGNVGNSTAIQGTNSNNGAGIQRALAAVSTNNSTGYALDAVSQGAGTTHTAGNFSASGATNNFGIRTAVSGTGNDYGVYSQNLSSGTTFQYALYAETIGLTGSGLSYGVYGKSGGTSNFSYGGYFSASGGTTNNYGLYSTTSANGGYGIYSENNSGGTGVQYAMLTQKTGNTGTGAGYGIVARSLGTGLTNIGGYFSASGATSNYAIVVPPASGNVILGAASGGTANAILTLKDGHLQSQQSTAPTVVANAGAGATATASLSGTDVAGVLTLSTGTSGWGTGAQATVTFNKTYGSAPKVIITAASGNTAAAMVTRQVYVTSTTTTFTINFNVAATGFVIHLFNYMVIEN
jgi:trimeric autotransporter adhesin